MAGRKPEDMSVDSVFKTEIRAFVDKLMQREIKPENSLLTSQRRGRL